MKRALRLKFQKGDFIVIVLVLVIASAIGFYFTPRDTANQQTVIQIYQDGQLIQELSPDTDRTIELTGDYTNTVEVRNGRVAIIASDCPGEDCVHSGWISSIGRSIVCLPNRVEIRMIGEAEVDFIVG